jgi:NADH-quinone oxidoreductase
LSDGMVSAANLRLLAEGSCADNRAFAALLGRAPLAPEGFAAAD